MKQSSKDLLCKHFKSTGHKNPAQVAKQLSRIHDSSGPKYFLDYLKKVSEAVRNTLITGEYTLPEGVKTKRYLLPSGQRQKIAGHKWIHDALRSALAVNVEGLPLNHPKAKKAYAALLAKHVFTFDKPQDFHFDKFNEATHGIPKEDPVDPSTFTSFEEVKGGLLNVVKIPVQSHTLYSFPGNDKKFPTWPLNQAQLKKKGNLPSVKTSDPRSRLVIPLLAWLSKIDEDLFYEAYPHFKQIMHYPMDDDQYGLEQIVKFFLKKNNLDDLSVDELASCRGKINHLMESGGKDRAIAQPFFPFQIYFEKLKKILANVSKQDPSIFTFGQEEGIKKAQEFLQRGNTLHCFDASSFTDRFPLAYQLFVLDKLGLTMWRKLLESFMEGYFQDPAQEKKIYYTRGQPMGLGPSFHLATVSHSDLVYNLYCKVYPDYLTRSKILIEKGYVIVGDDIVIADDTVAQEYYKIMQSWDVEINMTKSVESSRYGEFCGVIFDDSSQSVPIKPNEFKWHYSQLYSVVKFYGKNYLKFIKDKSPHKKIFLNTISSRGGMLRKVGFGTYIKLLNIELKEILQSLDNFTHYKHPTVFDTWYQFTVDAYNLNRSYAVHMTDFDIQSITDSSVDRYILRSPREISDEVSSLGQFSLLLEVREKQNSILDWQSQLKALNSIYKDLISFQDHETFIDLFNEFRDGLSNLISSTEKHLSTSKSVKPKKDKVIKSNSDPAFQAAKELANEVMHEEKKIHNLYVKFLDNMGKLLSNVDNLESRAASKLSSKTKEFSVLDDKEFSFRSNNSVKPKTRSKKGKTFPDINPK